MLKRISPLIKRVGTKRLFCGLSGESSGSEKLPCEMNGGELYEYFCEYGELNENDDIVEEAEEGDEAVPQEYLDYWFGKEESLPHDYESHINCYKLAFDLNDKCGQTYFVSCDPYKDIDKNKNIFCHSFAIIANAKSSIYVSSLNFSDYYGATLLIEAIRRGVNVKLVLDSRKTGTKLWQHCYKALTIEGNKLGDGSFNVKFAFGGSGGSGGFSHDKIVAADDKWAISTSADFCQYSRLRNYEAGFFTGQADTVKDIIEFFDQH